MRYGLVLQQDVLGKFDNKLISDKDIFSENILNGISYSIHIFSFIHAIIKESHE